MVRIQATRPSLSSYTRRLVGSGAGAGASEEGSSRSVAGYDSHFVPFRTGRLRRRKAASRCQDAFTTFRSVVSCSAVSGCLPPNERGQKGVVDALASFRSGFSEGSRSGGGNSSAAPSPSGAGAGSRRT